MVGQTGLRRIQFGQNFLKVMEILKEIRRAYSLSISENCINISNRMVLYFENNVLKKIMCTCPLCGKIEDVSNKQYKTGMCRRCRKNKRKQEEQLFQSNNVNFGMRKCFCGNEFIKSCKFNYYCPTCQEELNEPSNFKQLLSYNCSIKEED